MTQITKDKLITWLKAALIRAAKTWAQAGIAYLGTGAAGVLEVDWVGFLSVTCLAALVSILTSIAGLPEAHDGESLPSMLDTTSGLHGEG